MTRPAKDGRHGRRQVAAGDGLVLAAVPVTARKGKGMFPNRAGVAALVLAALMASGGLSAGEPRGPRITVDEPRFDFGRVRPGERPEHVFTVRNTGDEVLLIERVLPG